MYILNDSRAKVLITDPEIGGFVHERRSDLPFLKHIIYSKRNEQAEDALILPDIYKKYEGFLDPVMVTSDDMAYWLYSSGTTGFPKGAVHLHHDLLYCDLYGKGVLGFTENDRSFASSKLFFAYALGNVIHIPFRDGGSAVLMRERPTPEKVAQVLKLHKPTLFFSVPTFYSTMLKEKVPSDAFESVRCSVSAGEQMPYEMHRKWKQVYGKDILEGIGSTEFTYMVISNYIGDENPGCTGKPVPGVEARLVDENGDPCKPKEVGTLMVKAEHTSAFYWNQHEKSKKAFIGEWMNTGDCFYQDEDGYFYYVGREDDLIKSSGIWVYPLEVESILHSHPIVDETAVIGEKDDEGLVKVIAYVKLLEEFESYEVIKDTLYSYLRERLPGFKCPKQFYFVSEFPKTATGKLMRYKLR
jgi:benzoate-CoA ligase family protein